MNPTLLKTSAIPLCAALLLGACAPRPPSVPTGSTGIDLAPITLVEAEPAVREGCEASVQQALSRHGITVDPAGPRVTVEVAFWEDPGRGDANSDNPTTIDSTWSAGASTALVTRRIGYTADLTAIYGVGRASRKVLSSATAGDNEQIQNLVPAGGSSRIRACAIGAERLAAALVETMNDASR
jgi:hypothetical protein